MEPVASKRADVLAAIISAALLLVMAAAQYFGEPARIYRADDLLKYDRGFLYTVTDEMLSGERIYEDVFSPYGFLPNYAYLGTAKLFGNTPATFYGYSAILSAIAMLLSYAFLRRSLSLGAALLITLLVFSRCFLRHVNNMPYLNWEVIALFGLALAWRLPNERTTRSAIQAGILLALLQFCRFGGHLTAAVALVVLDGLWAWSGGGGLREAIRSYRWIAAGYLALFLPYAGMLFATLSGPVSFDVLWPSYMLAHYTELYPTDRFPGWHSFNFSVGTNLPIVAGLGVFGLAALFRFGQRGESRFIEPVPFQLALFPLYYLIAAVIYFRHAFHFWQYELFAIYGITSLLYVRSVLFRSTALLAWLPATVVLLKSLMLPEPSATFTPIATPIGITLYGSAEQAEQYASLWASVREQAAHAPTREAAFFWPGPGAYYFSGCRVASRHAWFLPEWIRPFETESVYAELAAAPIKMFPPSGAAESTATLLAETIRNR